MDAIDRRIVDTLQRGFPVSERPYAAVARTLGIGEDALLARLDRLLEDGTLTRFGPLFNADRLGGGFVLAAMSVPPEAFERVAAQVNAMPEVAHNYARDHALNMWFVVAAETPGAVDAAIAAIERATGLAVFAFPKEREYFVELELPVAVD